MMEYILKLREDALWDEKGVFHIAYGLNAVYQDGRVEMFPDISFQKDAVWRLMCLCEKHAVAPCHLAAVVEDAIYRQQFM